MKIALAQLNYTIGDFVGNYKLIEKSVRNAKGVGAELVVFSELAICGYPPHDLLENQLFIQNCLNWTNKVAELSTEIAIVIGGISINPNEQGKQLYNTAFLMQNGKIQSIHLKALLPTYDVFDEYRYFEPGNEFKIASINGKLLAITICEDLWDKQPISKPFGRSQLYTISPMEHLGTQNPDMIINIAGSPFSTTNSKVKSDILEEKAKNYGIPLVYVNQVGAHTDLIFDGSSRVIDPKGKIALQLKSFEEDFQIVETDKLTCPKIQKVSEISQIHDALVLGIRDYFKKSKLDKAILGLSGGIDSAVTLVLAVKAIGADKIRVLLMPSQYSSDHSVNDAIQLAQCLGVKYDIVPIKDAYNTIIQSISPLFDKNKEGIAEENIQSRIRGVFLMAISNKHGNILLNTSNKSEIATGYGTLYGDMNGALSVLGDIYKTQVYELANFINSTQEIIPQNTIDKAPSAELRPDQKDSDSLPEYSLLDQILFHFIELNLSANEIVNIGFESHLVERVIRLVNFNEYKRFQAPPVLRVSQKSFGAGRKMPLVANFPIN